MHKNEVTLNQYGFRQGGPIVIPGLYNGRGKAFFFFNYEKLEGFPRRPVDPHAARGRQGVDVGIHGGRRGRRLGASVCALLAALAAGIRLGGRDAALQFRAAGHARLRGDLPPNAYSRQGRRERDEECEGGEALIKSLKR